VFRDLWTRVDGTAVFARAALDAAPPGAEPIVLVHGIGVSRRYLEPTAAALAPTFRVYAPDLPGWGRSEKPRRALTIAELADALVGWLASAELETPTVLATSMGCQVLVDLAARRPRAVARLVLVGPTVDPAGRSLLRQAGRLARDALSEPPSLLPLVARDYVRFGPVRFLRTSRYALDDRIEHKLPLVDEPTLVVRGSSDALVSQRWAEEVARLVPRGELAVVRGRAHAVNFNAPVELAALVRDFVARTGSAR
jgi:2-hydroxy-6-oxonona-2,4-dienedioate hydrolase